MSANEVNAGVEFHDSEVSEIVERRGNLVVCLSAAYVHRSPGVPGVESGSGYVQAVEMEFGEATWSGPLRECIGAISRGRLEALGVVHAIVQLPQVIHGPVSAELSFQNGSNIRIQASSFESRCTGESQFVESFKC